MTIDYVFVFKSDLWYIAYLIASDAWLHKMEAVAPQLLHTSSDAVMHFSRTSDAEWGN